MAAYIRGLQEHGQLATAKHFPGHGDVDTDSHLQMPVLDVTPERLQGVELPPFRAAIDAGAGAFMTAHRKSAPWMPAGNTEKAAASGGWGVSFIAKGVAMKLLSVVFVLSVACTPSALAQGSCAPAGDTEFGLTLPGSVVVVNVRSCEENPADLKKRMEKRLLDICRKAREGAGAQCDFDSCKEGTICLERVGHEPEQIRKFPNANIIRMKDCDHEVGYLITWHYQSSVTCGCDCLDVD